MKIWTRFLAALLILCTLTGCTGQNVPQPTQTPATTGDTSQNELVENTAEPAEQSALYDPRGSLPYNLTSLWEADFVETSFADYYIKEVPQPHVWTIMVKPKEYDQFVPLCSKPNCAHDSVGCNAAVRWNSLGYCNNRLYFVVEMFVNSGLFSIGSMLPDGTDRRKEMTVPYPESVSQTNGETFYHYFHENKLVIQYVPSRDLPLEFQTYHMMVVDLETQEVTEPFKAFFEPGITIMDCRPVGSLLYCTASFRDPDGHEEYWLLSMDLETGGVQKLFPIDLMQHFLYRDNKIYHYVTDDMTLAEYDPQTGETEYRPIPVPEGSILWGHGDYVMMIHDASDPQNYEICDNTVYFLNREMELLDTIYLGENINYMFEDAEAIYFGPYIKEIAAFRIEKAKIGTGELELVPV